jgi:hypothetical protein
LDVSLFPVAFGQICTLPVFPRLPEDEPTLKLEYFFVLDCSGSMTGSRLERAKECLNIFLQSLAPGWFNICRFGSKAELWKRQSVDITDASIKEAERWIGTVQADLGGTELSLAFERIFRGRAPWRMAGQRQIFVLTDGEDFRPEGA